MSDSREARKKEPGKRLAVASVIASAVALPLILLYGVGAIAALIGIALAVLSIQATRRASQPLWICAPIGIALGSLTFLILPFYFVIAGVISIMQSGCSECV